MKFPPLKPSWVSTRTPEPVKEAKPTRKPWRQRYPANHLPPIHTTQNEHHDFDLSDGIKVRR